MVDSNKGKVVLVGAGPGDVGLLTLSGKQWLQKANVILYDHLVNPDMVRFTQKSAQMIYVGKKEGVASMEQEQINHLLISKAHEGKIVVRLKGGDPFLFGRGGEEIQAVQKAGIPFIIVPGVSSVMGVAAYAGIPLTHRHLSSTLSIITGSNEKKQGDIHIDWEKIAARSGTLVFLMGARKLPLIVEKLMKFGKNPDTPIAVIQWGTTARQKTWTGTLATIVEISAKDKILPPALTIIGEVVNLSQASDIIISQFYNDKNIAVAMLDYVGNYKSKRELAKLVANLTEIILPESSNTNWKTQARRAMVQHAISTIQPEQKQLDYIANELTISLLDEFITSSPSTVLPSTEYSPLEAIRMLVQVKKKSQGNDKSLFVFKPSNILQEYLHKQLEYYYLASNSFFNTGTNKELFAEKLQAIVQHDRTIIEQIASIEFLITSNWDLLLTQSGIDNKTEELTR